MNVVILNTEVETEKKPDYPWEEAAYCVCSRVLEQEGFPYDGEVELLLTTPEEIRAMNREHRDTDRVTDVLSFPMLDYEEGPADFSVVEGMELMYEDPETGAAVTHVTQLEKAGDHRYFFAEIHIMRDKILAQLVRGNDQRRHANKYYPAQSAPIRFFVSHQYPF